MELIRNGEIRVGSKMPTERSLAKQLNVSRNTVSSAYKELEVDGILKSYQGKGTFVIEEVISWKNNDVNNKINKFIDMAFEEALSIGMNVDAFLGIVSDRVNKKQQAMMKMRAVYVECNIEQAKMFSKQLSKTTNMNVTPITVQELRNMDKNTVESLEKAKVIISTFNHVNEVSELTAHLNKEVFGVAIIPDIETIVKIARYPDGTKFLFVCISEEFMYKIKGALERAGLDNLDIVYMNSKNDEEIGQCIKNRDVIIVSPGRYNDVNNMNVGNKEIIKFLYSLEDGSVKNLKSKMVELEE